jgi:hypothetical protein
MGVRWAVAGVLLDVLLDVPGEVVVGLDAVVGVDDFDDAQPATTTTPVPARSFRRLRRCMTRERSNEKSSVRSMPGP